MRPWHGATARKAYGAFTRSRKTVTYCALSRATPRSSEEKGGGRHDSSHYITAEEEEDGDNHPSFAAECRAALLGWVAL